MVAAILSVLAMLSHIAPWILLFVISIVELWAITSFRKRNGSIIWRPRKPRFSAFMPFLIPIVIIIIFAFTVHALKYIPFIVAICFVAILCLAGAMRNIFYGLYRNRVIGDQFVSEWSDIEKVIILDDRLRLVNSTRGAVDFEMNPSQIEEIVTKIQHLVSVEPEDLRSCYIKT